MDKEPLVTICIPNYNSAVTISQTLESLLQQTYTNIQIKIFDNASTDKSITIIKSYEEKYNNITLFQNETNIGGEANFTKCIANLEGEYGAIYHSDDLYLENMVEEQVSFLKKHAECSAVATHGYVIDENSKRVGLRPLPQEYLKNEFNVVGGELELFKSVLQYGNFITCPSVMGRVDIYKNYVKSWNSTDFKTSADLDVWFRLASFGSFGIIAKPLIEYRQSSSSYSYKDMRTRINENNMFLVLDFYMQKYKNNLSKNDMARYKFLLFKDNANRTINEIIKGNSGGLSLNIFDTDILCVAFESKNNFKLYIIGAISKILRNFNLSEDLRKKIYDYRFGE